MITDIGIMTIWTTDQERSLKFFTEKLGFEVESDVTMGEGGMRWITVRVPRRERPELALMPIGSTGMDPESAQALTRLVTKGVLGAGAFTTDDCRATYAELTERGVDFVQPPAERPYGIEAVFRDDSGSWYSLTQRHAELDLSSDWACED